MSAEDRSQVALSFGMSRILSSKTLSTQLVAKECNSNMKLSLCDISGIDINTQTFPTLTEANNSSSPRTNVNNQEFNSSIEEIRESTETISDCDSTSAEISDGNTAVTSTVNDPTVISKTPFPFTQSFLFKPSMERLRHKVYGEFRRVGHPYSNRTPPKRKKPRTTFSREQIAELEMRFNGQKYLASTERLRLAKQLHLTDSQVKTWFQNRRTKWRRQTAEEREAERNAATKYLLKIQQNAAAVAAGAALWPSILALQTNNFTLPAIAATSHSSETDKV